MSPDEIQKELENIGLQPKEAKVYLAALELGPDTAQHIAAKALVNRPTTYMMIESLTKRGLMSSVQRGKKKLFVAGSPAYLRYLLAQQRELLVKKEKAVDVLVEKMKRIGENRGQDVEVKIFVGFDAAKIVQDRALNSNDRFIREMIDLEVIRKHIPPMTEFSKKNNDPRNDINKRNRVKCLVNGNSRGELPESPLVRYIKKRKIHIPCDINIIDDYVFFGIYGEDMQVIMIKNKDVAATVTTLFDIFWEASK